MSNATTRLAALGIADLADAVVNSSVVGAAKPDERIYRIAAERAGVPVERRLFVDDSAANVAAARKLDMTAVRYRTIDDLRLALSGAAEGRRETGHHRRGHRQLAAGRWLTAQAQLAGLIAGRCPRWW